MSTTQKRRNGISFAALVALGLTVFLVACEKTTPASPEDAAQDPNSLTQEEVAINATTIQYRCAGGKTLTATYDHNDLEAMLTVITVEGDPALQNVELKSVSSGSGAKSSNGKLVWWTKEDQGMLLNEDPPAGDGKVLLDNCQEIPASE